MLQNTLFICTNTLRLNNSGIINYKQILKLYKNSAVTLSFLFKFLKIRKMDDLRKQCILKLSVMSMNKHKNIINV